MIVLLCTDVLYQGRSVGCVDDVTEVEVRIYYSYEQSNGSRRGINPARGRADTFICF